MNCQGSGSGVTLTLAIIIIIIVGVFAFYFLSLAPLVNPFLREWWRRNKTQGDEKDSEASNSRNAMISKLQGIVKIVSLLPWPLFQLFLF